jgi:hypothetical protein
MAWTFIAMFVAQYQAPARPSKPKPASWANEGTARSMKRSGSQDFCVKNRYVLVGVKVE